MTQIGQYVRTREVDKCRERLFDEKRSPFGVALTPVQCIHCCLTRPAVAAVLAGYDIPAHVEQARPMK